MHLENVRIFIIIMSHTSINTHTQTGAPVVCWKTYDHLVALTVHYLQLCCSHTSKHTHTHTLHGFLMVCMADSIEGV